MKTQGLQWPKILDKTEYRALFLTVLFSAVATAPFVAHAQFLSGPIGTTLQTIMNIIRFLIPLLLALAVLVFFWGIVKYVYHAEDEAEKENGKRIMIWGMIALFVMVGFWGIIGYVQRSFGISGSVSAAPAPMVNIMPNF
jgi:uncharacterized membrane protein YidH (DUF202 family)